VHKVNIEEETVRVRMAKRRKVEHEEGTVECFYCGKPVYENSWKCPNCGKWFREGRFSVMGIIAIFVIIIVMVLYILQPSFVFGGDDEDTEKRYGISLDIGPGPETHKAEKGGFTEWGVQMTSLSTVADNFEFSSDATSELQVSYSNQIIGLTSGQQQAHSIRVDIPVTTQLGSYNFVVYATSKADPTAEDSLNLTVDVVSLSTRTVVLSDKVKCDYILWTSEGDQRDDSFSRGSPLAVAIDPANKDDTYSDVIDGFSEGLLGFKTGETKVVVVPPNKGYTTSTHPLFGLTLTFQITLVSIDTA
jgi:hypothetical protein